ncbi:alpha-ribazole phosphatase [Reichenbachiella sp. 5M10]|uniref:alpha-ribazole phosphatase n=1 Tax=Reichenbachiella sp. 5M10 TaxID=1889772 RepID=UPI000C15768D|nr:alpha-ribazole phosphatase [Reichenbachiella sp. 5M10]PIB35670.1 alpha-ribazole phosphatase [Reichenbachiella sp. 5M10]
MEIYLVRHTTPDIGKDTCYGQSNVPLAKGYQAEMAHTSSLLPDTIDQCYTSPLLRCKTLAYELAEQVVTDSRLLELNFGDWELKLWDQIQNDQLTLWMKNYVDHGPPQGESYQQLADRVTLAWNEITTSPYETVVLVCHAGVIRALLAQLLNLDLQDSFKLQVDYGSVTKVTLNQNLTTICYTNRR